MSLSWTMAGMSCGSTPPTSSAATLHKSSCMSFSIFSCVRSIWSTCFKLDPISHRSFALLLHPSPSHARLSVISIGRSPSTICAPTSSAATLAASNSPPTCACASKDMRA
eukprot:scaffold128_cov328-Pavlova_lutheri.AAC.21